MGKHAVVRGEVHVSKKDRVNLFNRDLTGTKALYAEGRSDAIQLHKHTNSYFLFLIGYFTLELLYISTTRIQSLLPTEGYDVEEAAHKHGLEFEDETDLEIHEIYDSYDQRLRRWLPTMFTGLFFLSLLGTFFNETISVFGIATGIPYWITPVSMGIFTPLVYSGVLMILDGDHDRDTAMAETINSLTETRNHDQILVLVGDKHVIPVSDRLEDNGWSVTRERSTHWLARLRRLFPE
jgi:hypothetical protein